jgi:hypothetical protein
MKHFFICCLGLMGKRVCIGQVDRARLEKLDVHLQEAVRREGIPGAAVAVVHSMLPMAFGVGLQGIIKTSPDWDTWVSERGSSDLSGEPSP